MAKRQEDPTAREAAPTLEPWFEAPLPGARLLRPISRAGRRALYGLILGMLAQIPLVVGLAAIDAPVTWLVIVVLAANLGVPALFLWAVRGRIGGRGR